jgi:Bacterial Ig domain
MRSLTHGTAPLVLLIALLAVPATAGAAVDGGLKQLAGGAGCIVDEAATPAGCTEVRGMTDVGKIAVSPDGQNVYVPSRGRGAIAVFSRDANGALTQKPGALGCYTSNSTVATEDNCTLVGTGLTGAFAVAVSPDGNNVYAGGTDNVPVKFTRNGSGDLAYVGVGLNLGADIVGITVSPDNASVYTSASFEPGGLIGVFQVVSGSPGFVYRQCFASVTTGFGCVLITDGYVDDPGDLLVTPDNKQVLLANGENLSTDFSSGSVVGFTRTTSGASQGDLVSPTSATCISGGLTGCQTRTQMYYMRGLSSAANGTQIYAAGYFGVFRFNRDPSTNALSPIADSSACVSFETNPYTCGSNGTSSSRTLVNRDVVVSPDGLNVYSGNGNGSATTLFSMSRGGNGAFSVLPSPFQCLSLDGGSPCTTTFTGGAPIQSMIVSQQGRNVYAAGANRLFSFARDRAPVCQNVSANTAHNTSVAVKLSCSDPDGDAVSYEKLTDPPKGTLGGVQGDLINYNPLTGSIGSDSFSYRAIAAGATSDPATATVNVAGPTTPPPPPPPPPTLIPSTVGNNWAAARTYTTVISLSAKRLPAGAKVVVKCKTKSKRLQKKRCPYKSKSFKAPAGKNQVNLAKQFRKKKLPVGTTITITITAPTFIGKKFTYTIRRRAIPKLKLTCLAAGSSTKSVSCG